MQIFSIDSDNNITALADVPAGDANTQTFSTEKELAKLTSEWPASRMVDIWNSFAGVAPFDDLKPVRKFTSRKGAVARMWKAIERLSPDVAKRAEPVAPAKPKAKKSPAKANRRDTKRQGAKADANVAQEGSKKAEVLAMMRRPKGATLEAIMQATGWQAHTLRGFISGTLVKKLRLKVESFRTKEKERTYRIEG